MNKLLEVDKGMKIPEWYKYDEVIKQYFKRHDLLKPSIEFYLETGSVSGQMMQELRSLAHGIELSIKAESNE